MTELEMIDRRLLRQRAIIIENLNYLMTKNGIRTMSQLASQSKISKFTLFNVFSPAPKNIELITIARLEMFFKVRTGFILRKNKIDE